ncbi:MAG TPA: hypothetical protein VFT74_14425 [Isosphaeraceae bacterium]|nr:hypothetical protein [Isosphaeraceae bacterium]
MRVDPIRNPSVPRAFLGMVVVICLVEFGISQSKNPILKPDDWDWYLTGAFSRGRADGQQVLILGDSLVKSGVDPAVFGKRDISAFNLAMGCGQTPGAYYLLKRLVDRNQCPGTVVFGCLPQLLKDPPTINLERWPFLLSSLECLDYGLLTGDLDFPLRVMVQMLPSIRSRREIRGLMLASVGFDDQDRSAWPGVAGQIYRNRGHLAFRFRLSDQFDLVDWNQKFLRLSSVNQVNRKYLDKTIELALAQGAEFYWVITPHMPEMQRVCDQTNQGQTIDRVIAAYQRKYPSIHVLDFRRGDFPDTLFSDPHHLRAEGSLVLSERLVEALEQDARKRGTSLVRGTIPGAATVR